MSSSAPSFRPKALCIDLETARDDALKLYQLAAWRADTGASVVSDGKRVDFSRLAPQLDALADGAAFLLGHNVRRHDLPVLRSLCPQLALHTLKLVDTLELSPIAFPANPYHRLIKDYKLLRDSRNDPLQDAKLALTLWSDQQQVLQSIDPTWLAAYHYLLGEEGLDAFFASMRRAFAPTHAQFAANLPAMLAGRVCPQQLQLLMPQLQVDAEARRSFAYTLAWLSVAGGNSVLPPWVRQTYPQTRLQIRLLRETACSDPGCAYCSEYLDIRRELKRHFNHDAFRPQPSTPDGGSLQEAIVRAGYAGQSLLAILPTGGGKSICYQLPAISRYWRNGSLTVVVSPLQSLMKDQVDNLHAAGVLSAATLNGMLSMPERKDVLDKLRLGDVSILLVSPEQFRNPAFCNAIRQREIGCWVFDEAHCLSRWGHDFRTDYLYVTRYIREHHAANLAPVCAFTATAKQDVIDDLCQHFRDGLGIELQVLDGGVRRANLHYEVVEVEAGGKWPEIHSLLKHGLADGGGAVVFVSRRRSAEEIAEFLQQQGWCCAHYHAGLEAGSKKQLQHDFIHGALQVMVATNAFGMGVDKQDVRLVIHAEIPGSLENYLQEAGRAGRDQHEARCVLLYCRDDVETQFGLAVRSRLSRQDIAAILRLLKRHAGKHGDEMVLTSREILRLDPEVALELDEDAPDVDTKVRTALHWLEQAQLLERNENQTQVFPGSLRVDSLEDAGKQLDAANLAAPQREQCLRMLEALINIDDEQGISTDELTQQLGISVNDCISVLRGLEKLQLLSNDMKIGCQLRKGIADASTERLARLVLLEKSLLALMRENAPDAEAGDWLEMGLREVCQRLRDDCGVDVQGEQLLQLLRSLARPLPEREAQNRREYLQIRLLQRERLRIRLFHPWHKLEQMSLQRQTIAARMLDTLLARLPEGVRGANLQVSIGMGELADALLQDMVLASRWQGDVEREMAAVNAGLMYLHDNAVLVLDKGKAIFRAAMTIRLQADGKGRGFRDSDFAPLKAHYQDRTLQIHVMHEYARLGLAKMADALALVLAYFTMPRMDFIRRYFAGCKEELERAATQESYQTIVTALANPEQAALVCAPDTHNLLVLAGPGSGKTRVIVHRVAFLVRIRGELPQRILVLAFNRAAAQEVRQRLHRLLGRQALGVTVLTYHALALRLTGRSLAGADNSEQVFGEVLTEAIDLLTGKRQLPGLADDDDVRERLLAGYRYILVDEYQDIDQQQYALIAALAGRTLEQDAQLNLLAVGDDDQNIYQFRDTSNVFIRRFCDDYQARQAYLLHNYRSSAHIIAAANLLIAGNPERMKVDKPIEIDRARRKHPAGGVWERLDPLTQGRVLLLKVAPDALGQAQAVVAEILRRMALDTSLSWSDIAILSPTHEQLEPLQAWCESENIPYLRRGDNERNAPALHQVREGRQLLAMLQEANQPLTLAACLEAAEADCRQQPANRWLLLCRDFWLEQLRQWGDEALAASVLRDAFFEFSLECARSSGDGLTLSTVHQAKGGEWRLVVVLDGNRWLPGAEHCRLYYVAMTRARQVLVLCWQQQGRGEFVRKLVGQHGTVVLDASIQPQPPLAWRRRYLTAGMNEVFLSWAGRLPAGDAAHDRLAKLPFGASLQLRRKGERWQLLTMDGKTVGSMSKGFSLPAGDIVAVTLDSLLWRSREQQEASYRQQVQCDGWWVALPRIVLQPAPPATATPPS